MTTDELALSECKAGVNKGNGTDGISQQSVVIRGKRGKCGATQDWIRTIKIMKKYFK